MSLTYPPRFEVEEHEDFSRYLDLDYLQDILNDPDLLTGSSKAIMSTFADIKRTIRGQIKKDNLWKGEDINGLKKNFNTKLSLAKKKGLLTTIKKFKF